jgi:hypothetical protein
MIHARFTAEVSELLKTVKGTPHHLQLDVLEHAAERLWSTAAEAGVMADAVREHLHDVVNQLGLRDRHPPGQVSDRLARAQPAKPKPAANANGHAREAAKPQDVNRRWIGTPDRHSKGPL